MTGLEFLVGGWFASPIIKCVVEKANKYLSANYKLQKGTQELVSTLIRKLLLCQATVTQVEESSIINNQALADWLRMLKMAVYDVEDVLDIIQAKSIEEQVSSATSSFLGLKNLFFPDDNYKILKKAVDQLNQLSTDTQIFLNLVTLNKNNESLYDGYTDQRETISQTLGWVDLYGREEELNLILEMILGSDSEPSKKQGPNYNTYHGLYIIPIVGIGGVGKTALAQAVYSHPELQDAFGSKGWIPVPRNHNIKQLLRKIIQSLGGYLHPNADTLEEISKNLSWMIGGRRVLVVLDDYFEKIENNWDIIYSTLSHGSPGSVVIITTQNMAFAKRVATFSHIFLSPLEPGPYWKLFKRFAFGNLVMADENKKNLKQIGKQIAEKLHGLPLAAKIIGSILRSKIDEERWRKISKSEWWNLQEAKSRILPSICLGYEHLDPYLRQCFAYCSVFPRNSLLEKERLVQMWIAHDFVPHGTNGTRLEDVGRQWFEQLVEMSFFQPTGNNIGYVIPNLMHDLAIIVSSNECFYLNDGSVEIPQGVRHLAIDTKNLEMVKGSQKCKRLRSFFYFGLSHIDGMYSTINESLFSLKRIRVLDLSYLHMERNEPPPNMKHLTHLRFLDLSSSGIEVLTRSSFNHYHLQALHVRKCEFLELPREINKLINLRHLNVDVDKIALISGIGQLTSLQELDEYTVGKKEGQRITELRNMREITGHLKVSNCENIKSKGEAIQANFVDKKHVDYFDISWSTAKRKSNIDLEILDGLKPHNEIRTLRIHNYMGQSFPYWMMQISNFINLQTADLSDCTRIEVLPPLGELPSLKQIILLNLYSIKKIDQKTYGNKKSIFPALRECFIGRLHSCEEWTEAQVEDYFPHLSLVEIKGDIALKTLPFYRFSASLKTLHIFHTNMSVSLNLSNLPFLEDLDLNGCSELSIHGELQTLVNIKRLTILNCPKHHVSSKYSAMSRQKGKGLQVQLPESLRSLNYLHMGQSLLHNDYPQILGWLPSLRVLRYSWSRLIQFTEYETSWLEELTILRELYFSNCEFEELPSCLATLSSLRILVLEFCNKLNSLPANGMPPFLHELTLNSCSPNLVQRCQPDEGDDWHLISNVPLIRIDGRIIHRPKISEGRSG